jgi:predicted GIY-YIG superfamily endonuclease
MVVVATKKEKKIKERKKKRKERVFSEPPDIKHEGTADNSEIQTDTSCYNLW